MLSTRMLPTRTDVNLLAARIRSQCELEKSAAKIGYEISIRKDVCEHEIESSTRNFGNDPNGQMQQLQQLFDRSNRYLRMFFARKSAELQNCAIPLKAREDVKRYCNMVNGFGSPECPRQSVEILTNCYQQLRKIQEFQISALQEA